MFVFWLAYIIVFLPMCLIIPIKVLGRKNYNKKQNYIIICNHQSNFDPIILDIYFHKRIRFIAKKELWKGKEKSFFFDTFLGCISVDRTKGLTISATKKIYKLIEDKQSIGLFPEGTRHVNSEENYSIKNGACLFSIKTKTPILPCYIPEKQKAFKKNKLIIGKPFELKQFYNEKLTKEVLHEAGEFLANKMNEMKNDYINYEEEKKIIKTLKKAK